MEKDYSKKIKKIRDKAIFLEEQGKIESALVTATLVGRISYEYNQWFVDEELEDMLQRVAQKEIRKPANAMKEETNTVVFYDGFGLDDRGIAVQYLKALLELGLHVIYIVSEKYLKGVPKLVALIEKFDSEVRTIRDGKLLSKAKELAENIYCANCQAAFLYTTPWDVGGIIAFDALAGYTDRYLINLTDHAFWFGKYAADYYIEFRNLGACISANYRGIKSDKLIVMPFYPEIRTEEAFRGYPFEYNEKQFVVFSGGALYKTQDDEGTYYTFVRKILDLHDDVIFWYAGSGVSLDMQKLVSDYKGRVFHTAERPDLFQVMKHCDLYLSTFPIAGGLMSQYAAAAGVIPLGVVSTEFGRSILKEEYESQCVLNTVDELFDKFEHIYGDEEYRLLFSNKMRDSIITEDEFKGNLKLCIEKNGTEMKLKIRDVDVRKWKNMYLEKFNKETYSRIVGRFGNYKYIRIAPVDYVISVGVNMWLKLKMKIKRFSYLHNRDKIN